MGPACAHLRSTSAWDNCLEGFDLATETVVTSAPVVSGTLFRIHRSKKLVPRVVRYLTRATAAPDSNCMAKGLNVGDEVAIDATIIRRVPDDRISVSIPTYGFPAFRSR